MWWYRSGFLSLLRRYPEKKRRNLKKDFGAIFFFCLERVEE